MYWKILDDGRISLLQEITQNIDIGEYYMAGGTALSLQLGLRKSVDFDFFVPHQFNTHSLLAQLKEICQDLLVNNIDNRGTCDVVMRGVQVSFFEYPYRLLCDYVYDPAMPGLALASIADIAAMKAIAVGGRGSAKDFFDLYHIFHLTDYDTHQMVNELYEKFGTNVDFAYIAMGMNYFEDAIEDELPETYVKYDWSEMKKYFTQVQREFIQEIRIREKDHELDSDDPER